MPRSCSGGHVGSFRMTACSDVCLWIRRHDGIFRPVRQVGQQITVIRKGQLFIGAYIRHQVKTSSPNDDNCVQTMTMTRIEETLILINKQNGLIRYNLEIGKQPWTWLASHRPGPRAASGITVTVETYSRKWDSHATGCDYCRQSVLRHNARPLNTPRAFRTWASMTNYVLNNQWGEGVMRYNPCLAEGRRPEARRVISHNTWPDLIIWYNQ